MISKSFAFQINESNVEALHVLLKKTLLDAALFNHDWQPKTQNGQFQSSAQAPRPDIMLHLPKWAHLHNCTTRIKKFWIAIGAQSTGVHFPKRTQKLNLYGCKCIWFKSMDAYILPNIFNANKIRYKLELFTLK